MKLRNVRGMVMGVVLVAACVGTAVAQTVAAPPAAVPGSTPASGQLDLSDPQVQARLKAAGIDPDELSKLMGANRAAAGTVAPDAGPAATSSLYPAVPAPVSSTPVKVDSTVEAVADSVGELRPFGYDFFKSKPSTFEPLAFGPVGPDYLLGPGDEIIVSVWGAQELSARVSVNREGFVILPDVGQVSANGKTLHDFKESLQNRLAKIYSGVARDGGGRTGVDVSLGKLRSMQVFVLGDVTQPGAYTLSATSTIMNALYFAGGPTLHGSMREVRVVRGNQTVHRADLYDYLARGERVQDWKLENGDVVFVPVLSRQVTVQGEVRHPGIYELKQGETLQDMLDLAGGLTTVAQRRRIQVERIIPASERNPVDPRDREIKDVDLAVGERFELVDGDIVRAFRGRDILKNTVRLVGTAVYKPGTYQHRPGMKVSDLIREGGGLLGDAYTGWAHLIRTRGDKSRELHSFNLAAGLAGDPNSDLLLAERDEVQVFSIWDIRDPEKVAIQGLVRHPGSHELLRGMTITDLIVKAGGLKESAYRTRAEVSRIDPSAISDGKTAEVLYVAMGDSLSVESEASKFKLKKNDMVFVREIPNWGLQENVWVTGEVRFPGVYSLSSKTERLSSVIERAGGLESTAHLAAATFVRKKDMTGRMAIDFDQALRKGSKRNKYDLFLVAGDSIYVPREPKTVKVAGEVGFPSSILWEDGKDAGYYIDQAGGLLASADKGKITVLMASGRVERSGFFNRSEPDAGATVRVPRKPEEKERETLKGFAQIMSILSGAATTIYLISRSAN